MTRQRHRRPDEDGVTSADIDLRLDPGARHRHRDGELRPPAQRRSG